MIDRKSQAVIKQLEDDTGRTCENLGGMHERILKILRERGVDEQTITEVNDELEDTYNFCADLGAMISDVEYILREG